MALSDDAISDDNIRIMLSGPRVICNGHTSIRRIWRASAEALRTLRLEQCSQRLVQRLKFEPRPESMPVDARSCRMIWRGKSQSDSGLP